MDRITDVQVFRYCLPLAKPLTLPGVTIDHREGLLVQLQNNTGRHGWGEIAPLIGFSSETLADAAGQIKEIISALSSFTPSDTLADDLLTSDGRLYQSLDELDLYPSVRFGMEQAWLYLQAAVNDISVPSLLTDNPSDVVQLNSLLIGDTEDALVQSARQMVNEGYRAVKLKIGRRSLEEDVRAVQRVSRVIANKATLRLDANRAWTLEEAVAFARQIAGYPIEYMEEPLADPDELPSFAEKTAIPVALDESLQHIAPGDLNRHAYAHAVVIKPTLLGGFACTLRYVREARCLNMIPVISASFESGIGIRGLAALASGLDLDNIPSGLDTYHWLQEDLLDPPLSIKHGVVSELSSSPRQLAVNHRFLTPIS